MTTREAAESIGVERGTVNAQINRRKTATMATCGGSQLITLAEAMRYRAVVARRRAGPASLGQLSLGDGAQDPPAPPTSKAPAPKPAPAPPVRPGPTGVSMSF